MTGGMALNRDFREFCQSLDVREARYLIVGGYALAAHGRPRYTDDFDVWVEPTPKNAQRVLNALSDFGFSGLDITIDDLATPGRVVQLGYPPARIDLLTQPDGVDFATCYQRRVMVRFDDLVLPFLGVADLLANKRSSGRPQDLADVASLEELEDS